MSYHQWFFTGGNLVPHGTFGSVWRHFWLSLLGGRGRCYWRLVGKSQGGCRTPYNTWGSSRDKALSESLRKPAIDRFPNLKRSSREVILRGFPLTVISSKTLWTQLPMWSDDPWTFEIYIVAVHADLQDADYKPLLHKQSRLRPSSLCPLP